MSTGKHEDVANNKKDATEQSGHGQHHQPMHHLPLTLQTHHDLIHYAQCYKDDVAIRLPPKVNRMSNREGQPAGRRKDPRHQQVNIQRHRGNLGRGPARVQC